MPISSDQFEELSRNDSDPTISTNSEQICSFLRDNPETAFTEKEIAANTDITVAAVGSALVQLRERGWVDHREPYWRSSDHNQSVDAADDHAAATLTEREETHLRPQLSEWEPYAVDPRTRRHDE